MRMVSILSVILVSLSAPAFADDADLKKQVDLMNSAYLESFNKQDATGLAALFATDAIFVSQTGPRTDVMRFYEGAFKAGVTHEEATVDRVWRLGADTALGSGTCTP